MHYQSPRPNHTPSTAANLVRRLFYDTSTSPAANPSETVIALARAPFLSERTVDTSFLISAEEFFEENPLIAATLQPRTQDKYAGALENFRDSPLSSLQLDLSLDHCLCIYIQDCYSQNPKPGKRQEMANFLCMILIMYPSLRVASLGLSKRRLSGLRALYPAQSSAPFTKNITLALSWQLISHGRTEAAVVLLTTFCACLRISEALLLQIQDLAFPGDIRLASYGPDTTGMNIRDAKTARYTGKLQFVKLEDSDAIKLLQAWKAATNRHSGRVIHLSYQKYTAELKAALASVGLHQVPYTSHSARIGKATQDFVSGVPVAQIAINGRWNSFNSLRYYVSNGRAWLLNTQIPPAAQDAITIAAQKMTSLIQSCPVSAVTPIHHQHQKSR